ncbi:MAG: RagB/SusD family nutrient uptake outer membrane protein [Dysgonamonadaceae bacterium]|jgi:tetratricopeptide (TPR) repeat protein|nr:RagB/SusD family nutrient uptake outer membrane protein [Dysgonamonadaceae bacterium]
MLIVLAAGFASCNDWFDLRPMSDTISEDFWKDEKDVRSMVGACYRAMNEGGFLDRLMVWGEIRSDNVMKGLSAAEERNRDVTRILDLTLNATNQYASWTEYYQVINYCNTVIDFAPAVLEKDPNFTEAQLHAYLAEVKGIRALCYFILVRSFRNIPFSTEAFVDDNRPFNMPQSSPDEVINFLINDLKAVENDAVVEFLDRASDKGRITRKAIWCLIADMLLWQGEYAECISYCDKILNMSAVSAKSRLELEKSPSEYYNRIFIQGNSNESIFELQFEPNLVIGNTAVHSMYSIGEYRGFSENYRTFDAKHERVCSFDFVTKIPLFRSADLRSKDFYMQAGNNERFPIVKYVGLRNTRMEKPVTEAYSSTPLHSWIFYRLPDVYLMKAEALVESGGDLDEALACVSKSYDRANPDLGENSLVLGTREDTRELVFEERQREFLFEGKRYFDLLRRVKREGNTNSVLPLLIRKYEGNGMSSNTVRGKLSDLDALYMPISENELKTNPLLQQNPFYVSTSIIK